MRFAVREGEIYRSVDMQLRGRFECKCGGGENECWMVVDDQKCQCVMLGNSRR